MSISPLRYPGGKSKAISIIEKAIIEHFDLKEFSTIISPFVGGGSFEFYMNKKYNYKLIINDLFTPLFNFWHQIKIDKIKLCEELRKMIGNVSKDVFIEYRKMIMNLNNDCLQQAIYYFIINRCSFSGATLSGGFSQEASIKRFTNSSINKIEALHFDDIEIYNYDFEAFINEFGEGHGKLLFLDPPYYLEKASKLYGNNGDMHETFNHHRLYDCIKIRENWILCYNDCDYIKDLYKDFKIINVNWNYGMNKTKKSSEIIILSKLI
jgi:DNA adenine methylase